MQTYELKYCDHRKDTAVLRQVGSTRFGDTYYIKHGLKNRLETAAIKGEQVKSEAPELADMIQEAFERMRAKGRAKR